MADTDANANAVPHASANANANVNAPPPPRPLPTTVADDGHGVADQIDVGVKHSLPGDDQHNETERSEIEVTAMSVILCTAGYDHTIRFWEALSGICSRTIQHPDSQVNRLCISPDKRYLAAAGRRSVKLYDIKNTNPNPILTFEGHTGNVTGVGFHCEGKWMVTSSEDGTVKIWDTRTAGVQRNYQHGFPVNDVVIHPNQGELISCDRGGNVRIWDLGQNRCTHHLMPEDDVPIASVTVASDGSMLCVGNNRGNVFAWRMLQNRDVTSLVPLARFAAHPQYITRILLSPDVRHLATCSADHTARIWSADVGSLNAGNPTAVTTGSATPTPTPPPMTSSSSSSSAFASSSTSNSSSSASASASSDEASASTSSQNLNGSVHTITTNHHHPHHAGASSSSNGGIVPNGTNTNNSNTNNDNNSNNDGISGPPLPLTSSSTLTIPAGGTMPSSSMTGSNTAAATTTTAFPLESTLHGHQRWVWDCAFSADSAYLVTACSDHYARLWELGTQNIIRQYNGHHRGAVCVALNDYSER